MRLSVGLLLVATCAPHMAALEHSLEAPNAFVEDNILYCSQGLHLHISDADFSYGQSHILADSMRWDRFHGKVFLNGKISVLHAQYSLRADRLGFDIASESGEAWNVDLEYRAEGKRIRLHCDYLYLHPDYFLCKGLHIDRGNGSVFNVSASTIKIKRTKKPHAHRSGFTQNIDSILITNPRFKAGSVPFFYLPALYRDYRLDYPWTQFEVGHNSDRGAYVVSRIGFDLPRIGEFSSRLQYRNDHYELSGRGDGLEAFWKDPLLGDGSFTWFQMDPEILYADTSGGFFENGKFYEGMSGTRLARRSAIYRDLEHRVSYSGGAAYLRWSDMPESITGVSDQDTFRANYIAEDMRTKPLARQGVTAAWSNTIADFVYDQESQAMERSSYADRLHGIEINLRPLYLHDRIHFQAFFHAEQFSQTDNTQALLPQSETWRFRGEASLAGSKWLSNYGFDYSSGVRVLNYQNTIIDDIEVSDSSTQVPFIDMGIKTRLQARTGSGLVHSFTPRFGIEYLDNAHGDEIPEFNIGDDRHDIESDKLFIHTDFDNRISKGSHSFQMINIVRWIVREQDGIYSDLNGNDQKSNSPLYDIKNTLSGTPMANMHLAAQFDYDGLRSAWDTFDFIGTWKIQKDLTIRHNSNLIPETLAVPSHWQHQPGIEILGERYGINASLTFRKEGDTIDGSRIELTRQMVEGKIGIVYERDSDNTGSTVQSSIQFFISMDSF